MHYPPSITFDFQSKLAQFNIDFNLKKDWIKKIIISEGKVLGNIGYIFCSDAYLLKLNKKYLAHETYTDIITFDYVEGKIISGEIYISTPRVKENSTTLNINFKDEIDRVIAHGVLHLIGYGDHTAEQKELMRSREDYYLTLRP